MKHKLRWTLAAYDALLYILSCIFILVSALLADELIQNPKAIYEPVCFVDIDKEKTGREVYGLPVLAEGAHNLLDEYQVQEVVFALPNVTVERRKELY